MINDFIHASQRQDWGTIGQLGWQAGMDGMDGMDTGPFFLLGEF